MMKKTGLTLSLCLTVALLSGCEMYSESVVSDRRVQVREEKLTEQVATDSLDNDAIAGMIYKYTKSGNGPVDVTVTYDPESKTNTAMRAGDEAARISRIMRKEGAREIVTGILPVRTQGVKSQTIISYSAYQAVAPQNCSMMPGVEEPSIDHNPDYRLGCTVETVFAKQISNPSDLLGDARASSTTDGRVSTNIVDTYRTGAPNKPLKGQKASE